jgi:hypothetical protein
MWTFLKRTENGRMGSASTLNLPIQTPPNTRYSGRSPNSQLRTAFLLSRADTAQWCTTPQMFQGFGTCPSVARREILAAEILGYDSGLYYIENVCLNVVVRHDLLTIQTLCVWRNIEARSRNHCYRRKVIIITYSEFVSVALVIQHAMRMRYVVICGLPNSTIFSTQPHKRHFKKKIRLLDTKYVFWFSLKLLSETLLILRWTEREMITNVHMSLCKAPVILVRFKLNFTFHDGFSKKNQISNFVKIPLVVTEFFRANGTTDEHAWLS